MTFGFADFHVAPDQFVNVAFRAVPGRPVEKIALPYAPRDDMLLVPAPVHKATRAVVPEAVKIIHRICPWATAVIAPLIYWSIEQDPEFSQAFVQYRTPDGRAWSRLGGLASNETAYVMVSAGSNGTLTTAAHEAWHLLEARFTPALIAVVDEALDASAYAERCSRYHVRPEELRARAFEAWALSRLEGVPFRLTINPSRFTLDEVFAAAWSGELGQEFAKEGGRKAA